MTDNAKPLDPKADDGKTLSEKVVGQDSAPKTGIEREDTQSSDVLAPVAPAPEAVTMGQRVGMWSSGTGDTSGYGGMQRHIEMPGLAQQPFGGWYDDVYQRMNQLVPGLRVTHVFVDRGEITFFVAREFLPQLVRQLRDDAHLRFEICNSVSGVHYPADKGAELHAVYHLMSYTHNRRIRLEVACPETDPHIPSIVATYPMADYHERETWDMFGIIFDGHPGLTRILMPDDWVGHPQRKDYPLGGIPIEYKGAVVPAPDQRRSYNS